MRLLPLLMISCAWALPGLSAAEQAHVYEANLLCATSVQQERAVAELAGVILHEQPAGLGAYPSRATLARNSSNTWLMQSGHNWSS